MGYFGIYSHHQGMPQGPLGLQRYQQEAPTCFFPKVRPQEEGNLFRGILNLVPRGFLPLEQVKIFQWLLNIHVGHTWL